MLGALYMATDMVTSPLTRKGMLIFGVGTGFLTFLIRIYGSFPEGVSLAIIIMNMFVPLIDRLTRYGTDVHHFGPGGLSRIKLQNILAEPDTGNLMRIQLRRSGQSRHFINGTTIGG